MLKRASLLGLLVVLFLSSAGWADIPQGISFSGRLTQDGQPVEGAKDILFSIWNEESGGTTLWSELWNGVPVTRGVFNVILGSENPIDPSVFTDSTVYLEIDVIDGAGAPSPMAPRQQLVSVPFAYRAAVADTAAAAGGWTTDGSTKATTDYNVGIGTVDPGAKLEVVQSDSNVFGVIGRAGLNGAGIYGSAGTLSARPPGFPIGGHGVMGEVESSSKAGVFGENLGTGPSVKGYSYSGTGIFGESHDAIGIHGKGPTAGKFEGNFIITGGNAGIGVTDPLAKLQVRSGSDIPGIYATAGSGIIIHAANWTPGGHAVMGEVNHSTRAAIYGANQGAGPAGTFVGRVEATSSGGGGGVLGTYTGSSADKGGVVGNYSGTSRGYGVAAGWAGPPDANGAALFANLGVPGGPSAAQPFAILAENQVSQGVTELIGVRGHGRTGYGGYFEGDKGMYANKAKIGTSGQSITGTGDFVKKRDTPTIKTLMLSGRTNPEGNLTFSQSETGLNGSEIICFMSVLIRLYSPLYGTMWQNRTSQGVVPRATFYTGGGVTEAGSIFVYDAEADRNIRVFVVYSESGDW